MKVWGLDIGSAGIKAVELTRTWKDFQVTDYRYRQIEAGAERGPALFQALREVFPKGIRESVVLVVPAHRTMVHRVPLPFKERKKNLPVVKYEAESLLPVAIDEVIVDFYPPDKLKEEEGALVFAARKEDLRSQLALVAEAGVDPESMIPEGPALFWAVKYLTPDLLGETGAVLDIGHERATLIIWDEGVLKTVRSIPFAGALFGGTEAGPPPAQGEETAPGAVRPDPAALNRLANEVQRTLMSWEAAAAGPAVRRIFLTGGGTVVLEIENALGRALQRAVEDLDFTSRSPGRMENVSERHAHLLTGAVGAALWEIVPDGEKMNFRREEFVSTQKARKEQGQIRRLVAYAVILAVLAFGTLGTGLYLKERKYKNLRAQIRQEFVQTLPAVKKIVNEVQQMRTLAQEEKARVAALGGLGHEDSPLENLRELSAAIDPGLKIRVTELSVDPDGVEVSGEAASFDAINQLKAKLDRSQIYKDVQLKTARASNLENVVEFKLQMKRRI